MRRATAAILWLLLVAVGCGLGPPTRPDVWPWVADLLMGRWEGHAAWVVAEFQWMGLWPLLVGLLLRPDWRGELPARPPAGPFLISSFALGCYALLVWFIVRGPPQRSGPSSWLDRRELPLALGAIGAALLVWAASHGHPSQLLEAVRSDGFVWSMSVDFLGFWSVSVLEARARSRGTPWQWTLVPLLGLALFLALEAGRGRESGA